MNQLESNDVASIVCQAQAAGLERVKILHEPVAAALAYGMDVDGDETVFVFDLGGGRALHKSS